MYELNSYILKLFIYLRVIYFDNNFINDLSVPYILTCNCELYFNSLVLK